MKIKYYLLFLFLTSFSLKNFATHIVGGEIYYDCLGGNNYKITLKIYRDCYNGTAGFDQPAVVGIFDNNGNWIQGIDMGNPTITPVLTTINNPCVILPTNVCVEEGLYQTTVNLPPIPATGYTLAYQRCCRNNAIVNIFNASTVGSTYEIKILPNSVVTCNSSPRYSLFPPLFVCQYVPLSFDNSATDPDGDSLYYEICDPFEGADSNSPQPNPIGSPPSSYTPINVNVTYNAPYTGSYPMSSSPALSINHNTGLITGTPNMIGRWVIGICVQEWRNGVLLTTNMRDFQFNVMNCPNIPVASIPAQQVFCTGFQVNFTQASLNAFTYHWDFGDPSTNADTSNVNAPTWTYPSSGTYTVTLIINPWTNCADTTSNVFNVEPLLSPSFSPPPGQCQQANHFNFAAGGAFAGNGTFNWDFGTNATPSTSSLQNPANIVFNSGGVFPVILNISENGCTRSYLDSVHVFPTPNGNFGLSTSVSCILNPVQFVNQSTGEPPMSYFWDFANGLTSTLQNPTTIYNSIGTYNVSLIVTSGHGCKDTVTLPNQLVVQNPPVAAFNSTPLCTNYQVDFTQNSVGAVYYHWDFGDPSTTNDTSSLASPSWSYPGSGTYTATLTINPGSSCTATISHSFYIYPLLLPQFTPPEGQCDYLNNFNFIASGAFLGTGTFHWDFGSHANPSSSNLQNPSNIIFDTAGTFPVTLTITEHGCTSDYTNTVNVYPKPIARFGLYSPIGCVLYAVKFLDSSISDTPLQYLWDLGNGLTSTLKNPVTFYQTIGEYNINLIITTQHGCKDTFDLPSPLHVYTTPVAGFVISPKDTNVYFPNISLVDQSQMSDSCWIFWGDGNTTYDCGNTVHHYDTPGIFNIMQVVMNSDGCTDTAYSSVEILPQYIFWIPNAFTPNGNGLNDIFKPLVWGVNEYSFFIFDRWGEKIFETDDFNSGWDGTYKDHLCVNDVYVYTISFRDDVDHKYHQYIGKVTLVK